jgi:hypothetical protein
LTNAYIAYTLLWSARQTPCATDPSPLHPNSPKTATISTILELPGAIFYGDAINDPDMLSSAVRFQVIRANFEATGDINALWHDLSELDYGAADIAECVAYPANITNSSYGCPPGFGRSAGISPRKQRIK